MSAPPISSHSHVALPSAAFRAHRHDAHGAADSATLPGVGKPGQLPAGSGASLIAGAAQSLQQTVAAKSPTVQALLGSQLNVSA